MLKVTWFTPIIHIFMYSTYFDMNGWFEDMNVHLSLLWHFVPFVPLMFYWCVICHGHYVQYEYFFLSTGFNMLLQHILYRCKAAHKIFINCFLKPFCASHSQFLNISLHNENCNWNVGDINRQGGHQLNIFMVCNVIQQMMSTIVWKYMCTFMNWIRMIMRSIAFVHIFVYIWETSWQRNGYKRVDVHVVKDSTMMHGLI